MSVTNVFFLPFAGGSKYSYRIFEHSQPDSLKIIPLEYPGRGARMNLPLITNMKDLVDDLYAQVRPLVDRHSYAIYGHSMGGLAAYLLTRKILDNNHRRPDHLFVTGTEGPSSPERTNRKRYLLDKDAFILELRDLEGCPEEILKSEELLKYFEPILRADFQATETYVHERRPPLDIPFTVITGTNEKMKAEDILSWQLESAFDVGFIKMEGGHFFIFNHTGDILTIIGERVLSKGQSIATI